MKFPYVNIHADLAIDIINLFGGYKPGRGFKLQGFAGPGVAFTLKDPKNTSATFNGTLLAGIPVTDNLDINLGLTGVIFNDKFDGKEGGIAVDANSAVTIGITWNFDKLGWIKTSK
ncbi:MAG: hypothetical protein HUJ94_00435 [Bacteroidales bacterium]|nr:hypothetical protein [Bacteroidales bacterium]